MTVKQLKEALSYTDDDRIITIERPDELKDRSNQQYLNPTGYINYVDEYFIIYTD